VEEGGEVFVAVMLLKMYPVTLAVLVDQVALRDIQFRLHPYASSSLVMYVRIVLVEIAGPTAPVKLVLEI